MEPRIFKAKNRKRNIVKANKLITAREENPLTSLEQKILLYSIIQVQESDIKKEVQFTFQDFLEKPKLNTSDYQNIRKACKSLVRCALSLEEHDEKGDWMYGDYRPIFSSIKADRKKGMVKVAFNEFIGEYILNLKSNFTSYDFNDIKLISSGFAIRIYEFLMQGKNKYRSREFEVVRLLDMLSVSGVVTYTRFSNIRKNILDKASTELTEKTDINVTWDVSKKQGRRITHVTFFWQFKSEESDMKVETKNIQTVVKKKKTKESTPTVTLSLEDDLPEELAKKVKAMRDMGIPEEAIRYTIEIERQKAIEEISKRPAKTAVKEVQDVAFEEVEENEIDNNPQMKRLLSRLVKFGLPSATAQEIVLKTKAHKDTGIWKVLYDLNLDVQDGKVKSPKAVLLATAKKEKWIG